MNTRPSSEITVETLLALRNENEAVRLITERLLVKQMGPADHIRTKHEVKAFVNAGGLVDAERLLHSAKQRVLVQQSLREDIKIIRSQTQHP